MFETTSRLAENVATNVSRRRFLGSLGRWAGATALAVGGMLAFGDKARADSFCGPGQKLCGRCGCLTASKCPSFCNGR